MMRKITAIVMMACILLLAGCSSAKAENTQVEQATIEAERSEQAVTTAEQAAETSEQAATTAEQAAETSEQAATTAEQAAETSEQAATTAEQAAETSEQAATTAEQVAETSEQPATAQTDTAGADSVIIVFDDGVEVVAVKDGDVYRCTSSNGHTFKYEGVEIAPGRYLISDEAVKSWSGLLLFDRKVNGW